MNLDTCPDCGFALQSNFRFCPGCGSDLRRLWKCPHCGRRNEPSFKFCPDCGTLLRQAEQRAGTGAGVQREPSEAVETPSPPEKGITVEFPFSPSRTFGLVVDEAELHPSFARFGEGRQALYRVTYDPTEALAVFRLAQRLKDWQQQCAVYVDGKTVSWDSVFGYGSCFERRQGNYKPEMYCFGYELTWQFNIWGCIQVGLPFIEHAEWFTWGRFADKRGTWQFDKKKMLRELQKRAYPYRFCPAMDTVRMLEVFKAFPEQVNPNRDEHWKFIESRDEGVPGLVIADPRRGSQDKVVLKGVAPRGLAALAEIEERLKFRFPALAAR